MRLGQFTVGSSDITWLEIVATVKVVQFHAMSASVLDFAWQVGPQLQPHCLSHMPLHFLHPW